MRAALVSVGAACFLPSFTTAIAFLTLLSAHLSILRHFGFYAALGVMLTFAMTIVFVPWALVRTLRRHPARLVPLAQGALGFGLGFGFGLGLG